MKPVNCDWIADLILESIRQHGKEILSEAIGTIMLAFKESMGSTDCLAEVPEDLDEIPVAKPVQPELTLVDVRKALTEKISAGKSEEVKALLTRYGADRLSALDPAKYPEFLKEAEGL